MKIWKKVVVGGTLLAAAAVTGATVAGAAPGGGSSVQPPRATANVAPHAAIDTAVESKFTPIAPCRIVDTRLAGGRIGARAFFAAGTQGFITQGGTVGGCGIPTSATAIQVTVVAVAPLGSGYLRAWAFGAPLPTNSFTNYQPGVLVSTGGVIPISGALSRSFNLQAVGPATHAVVDVSGYFIAPMSAEVSQVGGLLHGSRVVGAPIRITTGQYEVDFDRNVANCTYEVTSFTGGTVVSAEPRSGNVNGVFIFTQTSANVAADRQFYLTVTC